MTVSNQIIEVLDAICSKFGIVIDWTNDNIVPYVTSLFGKLVMYEIWTSIAFMIFMTMLIVADVIFLKKTWPVYHTNVDYSLPASMLSVVVLMAFIACIISQTLQIIKCVTFPELFVYEYVLNFIENAH